MSITTPDSTASVSILAKGDGHTNHQCDKNFCSNRGLNHHLKFCKQNTTTDTLDKLEITNDRNETAEEPSNITDSPAANVLHKATNT